MRRSQLSLPALALTLACSESPGTSQGADAALASDGGRFEAGTPAEGGSCNTTVRSFPLSPGTHVPICSAVAYSSNPPTSGSHYPIWASYRSYPAPVARGFWVHDLEHGAIVITYNCQNCAGQIAALEAFLAARPVDPLCISPVRHRFVVTPDPLLDTVFAASAWGHALRSSCFDLDALGAFIDAHYARAPENLCGDGVDPLDPGTGYPDPCPQ